jgi:hypothetical protein
MKRLNNVEESTPGSGKIEPLQELINGKLLGEKIIRKHKWKIIFVVILVIFYIYNRNRIEARYRARVDLVKEVEALRYESLSVFLELMKTSSQAEVIRRVEQEKLGLEISRVPPVIIEK